MVNLITEYLSTHSEASLNAAYRKFIRSQILFISRDAQRMSVPEEDMRALYEDCWIDMLNKARSGVEILDFKAYLRTAIDSKRADLEKKRTRQCRDYHRECLETDLSPSRTDESSSAFDFVDGYNLEDDAINRIQREREQLSLLSVLVDDSDAITRKLLQAAREIHRKGGDINAYSLGKAIGVSAKSVALRFKRLQMTFDNLRYGNIEDYLTA